MPLALQFLAAIALLAALHTAVTALLGRCLGIAIREISLGFGPTLLSAGACRLRVLPLGGSVVFDDFDSQPRAVRVLLPLAAKCAALNLLPLTSMGGGQALLALVDPSPSETPRWKDSLLQGSVWLMLALAAAWAVAVGCFLLGR